MVAGGNKLLWMAQKTNEQLRQEIWDRVRAVLAADDVYQHVPCRNCLANHPQRCACIERRFKAQITLAKLQTYRVQRLQCIQTEIHQLQVLHEQTVQALEYQALAYRARV